LNFHWIVDGQVAAMAMPWPEDVPELKRRGVTAILSLSEHVAPEVSHAGFEHLLLPIRDFHPPTQAQLAQAVEFIDRAVGSGGACAVHCGAGLGRTGTVVAAWLVHRGRTAAEAIGEVRRRRPGSVETREQEEAVEAFSRSSAREERGR
jgi:atypical dual specificity phosphatase